VDYSDWKYMDLKKECARRNLGGRDKRDVLIAKLIAADEGVKTPEVEPNIPQTEFKPDSPNPRNPNYDMSGRWRRRPPGFVSWEDEALKE
jgi:hypothetical protein